MSKRVLKEIEDEIEEYNHGDTKTRSLGEEKIEEFGHRDTEKMSKKEERELPKGWGLSHLGNVCDVNPKNNIPDDIDVGFIGMSEASEEILGTHTFTIKKWYEIKKGYTHFKNDDVLLAKITPCFENGKKAIVEKLPNGFGAGSTEFFVLRPWYNVALSKWIYYFISRYEIRLDGKNNMSGAVGQQRIPKEWLVKLEIPLPPLAEQVRIAERLDRVLGKLKVARTHLEALPDIIKRFRKSVLAQAVSGKLTEEWRGEHAAELPSADELLATVRAERRKAWEEAELAKGKDSKDEDWKKKYVEIEAIDAGDLDSVVELWALVNIRTVGKIQLGRQRSPKFHHGKCMRPYLRVQNIFEDRIDLTDVMEMDFPGDDVKRYELQDGDILLNEGQSPELLGRPALYRGELPGACFTNTLIRFQAGSSVNVRYCLILFRHYLRNGTFQKRGTITTNIAHLSAGRFGEIVFPLPSLPEQAEIVRRVDELFAYADALEKRVGDARVMADRLEPAILAKAFRGELSEQVPEEAAAWALELAKIEADTEHMVKAGGKRSRKGEALEAAEPAGEYVAARRGRPRKNC